MATTVELPAAPRPGLVSPVRDRVARSLLGLAAAGAAVSAAASVSAVWQASSATTVTQTWQAYGYLVFAGLSVVLIVAYVLCRGWSRSPRVADAG